MTEKQIIDTISSFGFTSVSKDKKVYSKTYDKLKYQMSVDLSKKRIDFGIDVKKGDETTSHLENPENIVVLECVDRLLEKGYKPSDLTLEKKWKLGRTAKSGKADITVLDKKGKTLLIIECKTWGVEYEKELKNMKDNGGQLISYFQQDKNTRFLCLYASRLNKGKIQMENSILKVDDHIDEILKQREVDSLITYEKAKTVKEIIDVWKFKTQSKQTLLKTGIFENDIEPYNPGYIPLKICDLKDFDENDVSKVFNQFEEILRHNNISDRSNAFNRFISLVLAKIVDETKKDNEIADFQIKEGVDDPESLLERLQELYSRAMKDFLKEEVINYKIEDIEKEIENFPRQTAKETLYRIYKELKFYQNNEFAFKEVYNKNLFEENSKVIEEIVKLFQPFRFKYERKAQFLGDFFENMLEDGYRQSEGQFFTPTPITKFMVSSLPINSIIEDKLNNKEKEILPYVIDYACGSGHFLTEAIDEIITVLTVRQEEKKEEKVESLLKTTDWAKEFIYGIEKDYRLSRTSQVACFMHGDGDANIIFGDGLGKHERLPKDGTFDILIANPPYTIDNFKPHLKVDSTSFSLWSEIPDTSDDIEVLFVERMKQLLKVGGLASIVLPQSVLTSGGIFSKARTLLLEYFEFVSIVELGSSTFGETGTKTHILFLRRRSDNIHTNCNYIAEDFILNANFREGDFVNSVNLLNDYAELLGFEPDDYYSLLDKTPNTNILESDLYNEYFNWFHEQSDIVKLKKKKYFMDMSEDEQTNYLNNLFYESVLNIENTKFYHFLLTHRISEERDSIGVISKDGIEIHYPIYSFLPQNVLTISTGTTDAKQKEFLGYKFSKRRGGKGIKIADSNNLFNKEDRDDKTKCQYYVKLNYAENAEIELPKELKENLNYIALSDCIEFDILDFDSIINTSGIVKIEYEEIWGTSNLDMLGSFAPPKKGQSITKAKTVEGTIPVVAGGQEPAYFHNVSNREKNVITVSASGAYSGFVNYWDKPIFASDCSTIRSTKEKEFPTKLIYFYLKFIQTEIYRLQRGSGQPHVYPKDLKKIKLPVLSSKLAKEKLKKIELIEQNRAKYLRPNMKQKDLDEVIISEIGKVLVEKLK